MEKETGKEATRTIISAVVSATDFDLITTIGFCRGAKTVYEIVWAVPETDADAQDRYNCSLSELVKAGVRGFATRPDYSNAGFDGDGNLIDGGHEAMQKLADNYKVGTRKISVKSQEQKDLEAFCKSKGLTLTELIEKAKDL